jgi:ABC-type sugar transport system ATPase subunit
MPMTGHTTLLSAEGITKSYPGTIALDQVDFQVEAGEVHALVGENGAGKSTLMQIIAGVIRPDGGRLQLAGEPCVFRDPHQAQLAGVSLVFQELALAPNMSVAENVFTHTQPTGRFGLIRFREMRDATRRGLEAFGVDVDPAAPLGRYSLATQQIVEIARAIQRKARLLLLDEPTSAIGGRETERLFDVIRTLAASGVGVVYVSHKLDEVFAISNRITVLKDGRLVGTVRTSETTPDAVVRMMVGREFDKLYPKRDGRAIEPALEARGLTGRGYRDISFTAHAGEILGIFGLTGAGRTELARGIFGSEPCGAGEMCLFGKRIAPASPAQAMRLGIAYVPEDRKDDGLFLALSVADNIGVTNLPAVSDGEFVNNAKLTALASGYVSQLQIRTPGLGQSVGHLSGGNQQKVLFAKWLARGPKVFIVDEPTRGVDVGAKADIHVLLRELAQQGAAVIVISSELPEVLGLSDRIGVMRAGALVAVLDAREATEESIVALATGAQTC